MTASTANMEQLANQLKSLAGASTADLIGIAPGDRFSAEELGELGRASGPVRSIIVLAQHIVDPVQTIRFHSSETYTDSLVGASCSLACQGLCAEAQFRRSARRS